MFEDKSLDLNILNPVWGHTVGECCFHSFSLSHRSFSPDTVDKGKDQYQLATRGKASCTAFIYLEDFHLCFTKTESHISVMVNLNPI